MIRPSIEESTSTDFYSLSSCSNFAELFHHFPASSSSSPTLLRKGTELTLECIHDDNLITNLNGLQLGQIQSKLLCQTLWKKFCEQNEIKKGMEEKLKEQQQQQQQQIQQ